MRGRQGRVQSSVSNKLSVLPPRSIPQARAGRGNAVALQSVLLVFLRGWSKRVHEVSAQKFSFIKEQQWDLLLQWVGRGEQKDIISSSSCEATACEDGCYRNWMLPEFI